MTRPTRVLIPLLCAAVAGCGSKLPAGAERFTVGRTVVRTDSALDVIGVVYRLADTAAVPPRGTIRHWFVTLTPHLDDPALIAARAPGPLPVSLVLATYARPGATDTACGWIAPGDRRCFTGNAPVRRQVRAFLDATASFAPLTAGLEEIGAAPRHRDLEDAYTALTAGKALDSAVMAYSGFGDLSFDVTLARTLTTGNTTPSLDPASVAATGGRIFLTPDLVFNTRSYRSPNYVWLALSHQMAHQVVNRVFQLRPDVLRHGFPLRNAVAPEMARVGHTSLFWDEGLGEQLASAITIRILALTSPSITWAARTGALNNGMALVPYLEDALLRYEAERDSFPTLADFAGRLGAALDSIPTTTCRAAPSPGVALIAADRHRAVVGWLADDSPFRARRLLVGDTVLAVDGDSVSAGGLLTPTRQVSLAWAQHLPYELGILDIRRGGRDYAVQAPVTWVPRLQVRVASQAPTAADSMPICRWVTRARRTSR